MYGHGYIIKNFGNNYVERHIDFFSSLEEAGQYVAFHPQYEKLINFDSEKNLFIVGYEKMPLDILNSIKDSVELDEDFRNKMSVVLTATKKIKLSKEENDLFISLLRKLDTGAISYFNKKIESDSYIIDNKGKKIDLISLFITFEMFNSILDYIDKSIRNNNINFIFYENDIQFDDEKNRNKSINLINKIKTKTECWSSAYIDITGFLKHCGDKLSIDTSHRKQIIISNKKIGLDIYER